MSLIQCRLLSVVALAALVLTTSDAAAQASRPTSRPGGGGAGGAGGPILTRILQPYHEILAKLNLTQEQKINTDAALRDGQDKLREMLPQLQGAAPRERLEKLKAALDEMNDAIAAQLSDEQKPRFRDGIKDALANLRPNGRGAGAATRPEGGRQRPGAAGGPEKPAEKPPIDPPAEASVELKVGDAPPDVPLKRLDGNPVHAGNKGRTLVMIFGSYSSPTFREKAAQLNDVVRDYRGRNVDFLLIYTAEAFPSGEKQVDRNRRDKVEVPQAKTLAERTAAARSAQQALKLEMSIALDDMEGSVAKAYGLAPNGIAVIGKDGKIGAIQKWEDPFGLRSTLDEVIKTPVLPAPK